jgi:hypothetical protein
VKPVKLHFAGASKLKLNADGDLSVIAKNGEIAFHKPVVYQEKDGQRQPVGGKFTLLAGNTVGFTLGDYDRSRELVIDPVLAYSTYLSNNQYADLYNLAIDAEGNAYMLGGALFPIYSPTFPPSYGAYQTGGEAIAVVKLNPAGTAVIYTAAFSGSKYSSDIYELDQADAIAVDADGDAYVAGIARSLDFPVTSGAFQQVNKSTTTEEYPYGNAFVTKLNPSGSGLIYSTLLGGTVGDHAYSLALDSSGDAYVAGVSYSSDFPITSGAFQTTNGHGLNGTGFVSKLNPAGSSLVYSTFVGTTEAKYSSEVDHIAVNSGGQAYLSGYTGPGFPITANALLRTNPDSGYLAKLGSAGNGLIFASYGALGPQIALDPGGNIYIDGCIPGVKPTPGAFQTTQKKGACVTKLNLDTASVIYSTYLGGSTQDTFLAIAVDAAGDAFVAGESFDDDFPVTPDAYQSTNRAYDTGGATAFLTEVNPTGTALIYSTYFGGSGGSAGESVAIDSTGNAYLCGTTYSSDFPVTPGAYITQSDFVASPGQPFYGQSFLAKFAFHGATTTTVTPDGSPEPVGAAVTLTAYVASVQDDNIPYGEVQFIIDGVTVGASLTDDTGHAAYSTSSLLAGKHAIQATYIGSPSHAASTGTGPVTIVGQTAAPSIVPVGGTYRGLPGVTITDATGGAVIHYTTDGSVPGVSSPVYSTPIAVTATTTVKAIAVASGDSASAVTSTAYTIVPGAKNTATLLTASPTSVTGAGAVKFTATVTTTDGTVAQGTVTFLHGDVVFGTAPLSNGTATLSTTGTALGDGSHGITAFYSGSATEAASQSPAVVVSVNP